MNLARLDLNLMIALDALLRQRSVTRAAEQLGLSQPALSASLGRLRRHFGDELLTRAGNEYRLTPLALQLRELTAAALAGAERVFTAQPEFDVAASRREFSLLISDYGVAVLGDVLARRLVADAPAARLRLTANSPDLVDRAHQTLLSTDVLVMPHGFVTDLSHRDLYRDEWVCLVAADNAGVADGLTVGDLRGMPWVVSYHSPTASTPAARQMRQLGIEPRVQVITENFLTVPGLVAGTGRIALLQRRLTDRIPPEVGVRALPSPVPLGPLVEAMWWHPVYDDDPAHQYLRRLLVRAAGEVAAAGSPEGIDGGDALRRPEGTQPG